MSDDLGRGMLSWPAERWQTLDSLGSATLQEHGVLQHVVEEREEAGAYTVRIAGQNVDVDTVEETFQFDMVEDGDADVERKVRLAAQSLAVKEDEAVLREMDQANPQDSDPLDYKEFSKAKNALRTKGGVQGGLGVVVSSDTLTDLETNIVGAQSGLEVTERLLGAKVLQTNALPSGAGKVEAILVQASPPAYQMVRAWGPRLRVVTVANGKTVTLSLEQGIAVGELEQNRCLAIRRTPAAGRAPRTP